MCLSGEDSIAATSTRDGGIRGTVRRRLRDSHRFGAGQDRIPARDMNLGFLSPIETLEDARTHS